MDIPNWAVALLSVIAAGAVGWIRWVSIGVSKISSLVTKAELLATKIKLMESHHESEKRIIEAINKKK